MKREWLIKKASVCFVLMLCLMLSSISAFAAGVTKTVSIPVSAKGADCTVVIYDADGKEQGSLDLKDGETKAFSVECAGLDTILYTIQLSNKDTNTTTYDKTVYTVKIELYQAENGEITYTIEADPLGILGDKNSGKAESIAFTNTKTPDTPDTPDATDITVKKVWANTQGDDHPASVKISLLKDGTVIDTVTLNEANKWMYTWLNLDKNGKYSVSEPEVPEGYTVAVSGEGNVFTVTNTKTPVPPPDTTAVSVKKVWVNTAGAHPDAVKVNLLRDGQVIETVTLNEANGWNYKWTELAEGSYSVSENDVPAGYTVSITADGTSYTITNTKDTPNRPNNPNTPKTGDNTNLTLWYTLSIASFVGLALMAILVIRNRRKERADK